MLFLRRTETTFKICFVPSNRRRSPRPPSGLVPRRESSLVTSPDADLAATPSCNELQKQPSCRVGR